ncbi:erythromycin esterase family protein [Promicromonospora sp. NPDC060271]|uniref:erythromycin esterase family protein n=1 Tax=Promicromonospora sp. NPDC060271 TaxID=3347089 RepID=UPI00365F27F2
MVTDLKETIRPVDSGAVMGLFPARPRILALGEPTHGESTLHAVRNELLRQLVEQEGYRTIALESDCLTGLLVDDYVTAGEDPAGTRADDELDDVMARGLSHEWGAFPGNRELVRWMRSFNAGRPASDRLRFAGVDGPLEITAAASPRPALTALHGFLAERLGAGLLPCSIDALDSLVGPDDRWTEPAAMMDPSRSVGQSAEARELRLIADDLVALLGAHAPGLVATSTPAEWELARLYGRTATGLLRYHFWMADSSPGRMTWLLGVRDAMIAANLLALAERGPVLVSAHNSHLQRTPSTMRMWDHPRLEWWGAGAQVAAELGAGYAFLATAVGTIRHQGVDAPPSDSVEGLLYAVPGDHHLLDAGRLVASFGEQVPDARVSPWFGYAPLDPAQLAAVDGIVFVRDAQER